MVQGTVRASFPAEPGACAPQPRAPQPRAPQQPLQPGPAGAPPRLCSSPGPAPRGCSFARSRFFVLLFHARVDDSAGSRTAETSLGRAGLVVGWVCLHCGTQGRSLVLGCMCPRDRTNGFWAVPQLPLAAPVGDCGAPLLRDRLPFLAYLRSDLDFQVWILLLFIDIPRGVRRMAGNAAAPQALGLDAIVLRRRKPPQAGLPRGPAPGRRSLSPVLAP